MTLPSWLGRWAPMSGNRKITVYSTMIRDQCRQLISDKKATLGEKNDNRTDVLSVLLRSRDLSDEVIQDQMLTFLAAGCVEYPTHYLGSRRMLILSIQPRDDKFCLSSGGVFTCYSSRDSRTTEERSKRDTFHISPRRLDYADPRFHAISGRCGDRGS
jgi:hypothetical protein